MTLRLFNGYDDDAEEQQEASVDTSPLPRFTNATYTVFPPFGERFRDLSQWEYRWNTLMPGRYRFWPGFTQGGIVSLPDLKPGDKGYSNLYNCAPSQLKSGFTPYIHGNEEGMELLEYLSWINPMEVSDSEIERILSGKRPKSRVTANVTLEHAEGAGNDRYVLIVPKKGEKPLKHLDLLHDWFDAFGVRILEKYEALPPCLTEEARDWFANPDRKMLALRIDGGLNNAAWQTAVLLYISLFLNHQDRNLQSMIFVARIQGRPNYRKHWTSNK